jgi:spore germination cell wall hydrolase CwlJ-like protein
MPDIVNGATHFHTRGVKPGWKNMVVVARIDNHIFLRQRKH